MKYTILGALFLVFFVASPLSAHAALPTTWTPSINLTSNQKAVWAQMLSDYTANSSNPSTLGGQLFKSLVINAQCKCRYGDDGLMAAALYQITGDPSYISLAWQAQQGFLSSSGSGLTGNNSREEFIDEVTMFDWLYTGLTSAQRQQLFDKINEMATDNATNPYSVSQPIRTTDSDETIGNYFGMTLWYELTKSFNPTIVNIWNQPWMGGLSVTGNNLNTMRNAVAYYANNLGTGGEWMESGGEYNMGTETLLLTGVEGMKTLMGTDYYPEITSMIPAFAQRQLSYITDDLNENIQWGDEENAHSFGARIYVHSRLNAMLAGLTKGTAVGAALQDLELDIIAKYPPLAQLDTAIAERWLYYFDPYAIRGDRTAGFFTQFASGMGTEFYHDGRGPLDSLFWAQSPKEAIVDHTPHYLGDFQLYRKGSWAITHPLSYAGAETSGHGGANSMVIGGEPFKFWEFSQVHRPLEQEFGNIGSQSFAYMASVEGGQVVSSGSYNPPPTFLHEHSRSILYLPSSSKNVDTIVVYDRVNAQDPTALPGFTGYPTAVQAQTSAEPNNKEWFIHMPVSPSISNSAITWSAGPNTMKVSTLLPANHTSTIINEVTAWPPGSDDAGFIDPAEKKYSVRISPATSEQWDTFLNVLQAANPGVSTTNTLVKSTGGEAEGVVISRPGQNDIVTLFNARPSQDLPQLNGKDNPYNPAVPAILMNDHLTNSGYSVTFNLTTASGNVLFADLDPTTLWTTSIDGGNSQSLSVDSQGLGKLNLSGSGSHTIYLVSTANPNPAPVTTPTTPAPIIPPVPTPIVPPTPATAPNLSTKFAVGDRVSATSNINVRSSASVTAPLKGTQPNGTLGTIISGGTYADGYYWWNVNYDNTANGGWSVEDYLTKVTATNPTPTPAPATAPEHQQNPETSPATETPHTAPTQTTEPSQTTPAPTTVAGSQAITWTNLVNASASGSNISKTGGTEDWDAGAISNQSLPSGDGYVEFTAGDSNTQRAFGLGSSSGGTSDTGINFAVWLSKWGTYYCRINGVSLPNKQATAIYKSGDTFRASLENGVFKCYQNGSVVASTSAIPHYPLFAKAALFTPGSSIQNAVLGILVNTGSNTASVLLSMFNLPTIIILLLIVGLIILTVRTMKP